MTILTLKEVAKYFKVHEMTVYRLAKQGKIPSFRIGSAWRFSKEELNKMFKINLDDECK